MLRTIIEKEVRDIIGSSKFVVLFGACAILILMVFFVGANNYHANRSQYEAAEAQNLKKYEGMTDWFGIDNNHVFLPPSPLTTLVPGISNDIGRTTMVYGRGELDATGSRFNEEPIFAVFRFLDLGFIFEVVLSLLAILLGYDLISGEKEKGTLRLTFANAVPRAWYALGKLIGAFIALAIPLALVLCLGGLILIMMGVPMTGSDWASLAVIDLTGILYFGAFLTLAIMVSAMTVRTSRSFLALLVIWIFAVLIIPRASVLIAGRAVDVPSTDELANKKNIFNRQLWAEDRDKMSEFKPSGGAQTDNIMDEFNRFMDNLADERDEKMRDFSGRLNEERANAQVVQQKLALNIARISPATSVKLATSSMAGTSLDLKQHYKNAATRYQEGFGNFLKEKTGMNAGGRMIMVKHLVDDGEEPEPIDINELPRFTYHKRELDESLNAAAGDMGLLAIFNIVFFAGAFVAFNRYDLR